MATEVKTHKGIDFRTSPEFWEKTYRAGNTSGSGSYGKLAEYKAKFLNAFAKTHNVHTVVDLGCGDGNQLSLGEYEAYVGLDVSPTIIEQLSARFADDATKRFQVYEPLAFDVDRSGIRGELAISLDVTYHLVEDEIFEKYIRDLFAFSERYVILYTKDLGFPRGREGVLEPLQDEPGGTGAASSHVRQRNVGSYIARHLPDWRLVAIERNAWPEDSPSDFFIYERAR